MRNRNESPVGYPLELSSKTDDGCGIHKSDSVESAEAIVEDETEYGIGK